MALEQCQVELSELRTRMALEQCQVESTTLQVLISLNPLQLKILSTSISSLAVATIAVAIAFACLWASIAAFLTNKQ